ncbi:MAG: PilZ domain-containing protein [Vicinamibacterales bacterium]
MSDSERRRSQRVQIFGALHGHLVALDAPITVTEISLGGLGFETPIEFPVGIVHEFRLTLGDGSTVAVKGRVMHTRRLSPAEAAPNFAVGVQFVDDDAEVDSIAALVKAIEKKE